MRKGLLLSVIFLLNLPLQALTVTSLNIQWFGRGGRIEGTKHDEYRQHRLTQFLLEEAGQTDVYAFQEVMDPSLISKTLPHLECHTYEPNNTRLQHVVLCAKPSIIISKTIDEPTRLGRFGLRPAVILTVKNSAGEAVNVIGMHLKAGRSSTQVRVDQIKAFVQSPSLSTKSIVVGDFNTFDKQSTGLAQDDLSLIEAVMNPVGLKKVANDTVTYLGRQNRVFDWAWTKGLTSSPLRVIGPCDQTSVRKPFQSYGFYKRFVSDHCAVQITAL